MSHLRLKLKIRDRVCRADDPRHVGVLIRMFKSDKFGGWTASIRWEDHGVLEYVPMDKLVHAEEAEEAFADNCAAIEQAAYDCER